MRKHYLVEDSERHLQFVVFARTLEEAINVAYEVYEERYDIENPHFKISHVPVYLPHVREI